MSVFKGEAVTGELSKLLDEIKLCQEKEYSFEDLSHTISDHYLDNFSKVSEEELMTSGSQTKLNVVSKMGYKDNIFSDICFIFWHIQERNSVRVRIAEVYHCNRKKILLHVLITDLEFNVFLIYKNIAYHTSEWLFMATLISPKVQVNCSFECWECKERIFEKSVEISMLSTILATKCLQNLIRSGPQKKKLSVFIYDSYTFTT